MRLKRLYQRVKYRKQIKQGYGLLSDAGEKKTFTLASGRLFFLNGVDPLVRHDLATGKTEAYKPPKAKHFTDAVGLMSKNVYVWLDGTIRPTPFNMPREGLWYFDGQVFYQKAIKRLT